MTPSDNRKERFLEQDFLTSPQPEESKHPYSRSDNFLEYFGNKNFRTSWMTYVSLVVIVLFAGQAFLGNPLEFFANLTEPIRLIFYIWTIISLWVLYGIIYLAIRLEKSDVTGIGLVKIRFIDYLRGLSILLTLFVVASFVNYWMFQLGFEVPKEVENFLPQKLPGKLLWVVMSFTAGFCEETVFRGYLMTRIRLLGNFSGWTIPVIISALLFGIPHLYQGFAGVVVISILGAIFSISYIYYKSIWPAIIAHFFLDFLNLFIPWFESVYERIMHS